MNSEGIRGYIKPEALNPEVAECFTVEGKMPALRIFGKGAAQIKKKSLWEGPSSSCSATRKGARWVWL